MIVLRKLFSIQAHNRSQLPFYKSHNREDLSIETIDLPWGDSEKVITDSRGQLIEKIIKH